MGEDIREQRRPAGASRRSLAYTALATALVGALLVIGYRALPALRLRDVDAERRQPQVVASPGASGAVAPAPSKNAGLTPFAGRDFGYRTAFRPAMTVEGPFEPVEAHIFRTEDRIYVLDGIAGPPAAAICLGGDRRLWACGLQARAALIGLLRQAPPFCRLVSGRPGRNAREPGSATQGATWACTIGREDMAVRLVAGGWALPITRQDRDILAARDAAQAERRGLWDGGWNLVRVPGSETVPMSASPPPGAEPGAR